MRVKNIVCILILLLVTVQVSQGQDREKGKNVPFCSDTAILFRFVPKRLMFYSPYNGNEKAISEAMKLLRMHRKAIVNGDAVIRIRGFCQSYPTEKENLAAAKNRSNQVKSYFITHLGMKESYYRTSNEAIPYKGMRDIVALVDIEYLSVPDAINDSVLEIRTRKAVISQRIPVRVDTIPLESVMEFDPIAEQDIAKVLEAKPLFENEPISKRFRRNIPLSVKTNLLYDVILLPSLEFEYRFNKHWSVNLEGTMAWWHKDTKHKYYQLAQISPEVRYWFKSEGARKGHYFGLFIGGGWYDLENGNRGYKGEGEYAGISYGYMFPIGKYFALEAGIGAGFLHANSEDYLPIDEHYVYQQSIRTNYFGPLKLKLAFVWNIGCWMGKKGGRR
ncbi:DUF3575 domain-containing protein [uncultured Coprobacter sp.]|jgi:hypothetical protein|uniref:DUF3575 domain-containing protein n=1 Tax=uncultured Coprobacter sp. TaxID=1720550 RepID=UPI0025DE73B3|nr:DUF3575 domain-containing protein [uncultured Coprobacter sp.]